MRATVVGAGVSGLTTAVALLEAGWQVEVVAREGHQSTVSSVAAAVWTMTTAEPRHSVRRWALASRERFRDLALDVATGVVPLRQLELERDDPGPVWWEATPHVRRMSRGELPSGYATGFEVDGFAIEPPVYLDWLKGRLLAMGGTCATAALGRLAEAAGDVVVNCTGLGARELVGDTTLYAIRGQVVAVANPGIREAVADESDPQRISYVYPRSREVILGGTREKGRTDVVADTTTTARILQDCVMLDPRVAGLEVLDVRVGLRPGRPAVRLERSTLDDGRPVVHNYGHGGAGFILSWGCALDVVALAGE